MPYERKDLSCDQCGNKDRQLHIWIRHDYFAYFHLEQNFFIICDKCKPVPHKQ